MRRRRWHLHDASAFAPARQPSIAIVGIEAERPGSYTIPGAILEYHIGAQRFRSILVQGYVLCATDQGRVVTPHCRSNALLNAEQKQLITAFHPPGYTD